MVKGFVKLNLCGVWGAEYCEWNTCGIARSIIIRTYNWTISFSWSQFFAASSRRNLSSASLSYSSSFIHFTFTSASLLIPAANCDRACSCEQGWVTIFLFKRVLSGDASCSKSSSLNSFVSDSFALSFSFCCCSCSEFSSSFCCYQLGQNIERLTLYLCHLK